MTATFLLATGVAIIGLVSSAALWIYQLVTGND